MSRKEGNNLLFVHACHNRVQKTIIRLTKVNNNIKFYHNENLNE